MSDQTTGQTPDAADPEPTPAELAFRMGLALGRIEGLLDAMVSRLDRRTAEITRALEARESAETDQT